MRAITILTALAVVLGFAAPAGATLLADVFGVTLSLDGTGSFNNSWAPVSASADYFVDDNWSTYFNRPSHGGELFDIEAIYFDDTPSVAYIAVVTSLPVPVGASFLGETVVPGDLGLTVVGKGLNDFGIDIDGGTGSVDDVSASDWFQANTSFLAEFGPTNYAGGVNLGYATVNYYDYGLVERGYSTYVFEVVVDRGLLGSPMYGDAIGLDWTIGCRNDVIHLDADFDGETVVPEPGTLLLLSTGLLGVVGVTRRRRG